MNSRAFIAAILLCVAIVATEAAKLRLDSIFGFSNEYKRIHKQVFDEKSEPLKPMQTFELLNRMVELKGSKVDSSIGELVQVSQINDEKKCTDSKMISLNTLAKINESRRNIYEYVRYFYRQQVEFCKDKLARDVMDAVNSLSEQEREDLTLIAKLNSTQPIPERLRMRTASEKTEMIVRVVNEFFRVRDPKRYELMMSSKDPAQMILVSISVILKGILLKSMTVVVKYWVTPESFDAEQLDWARMLNLAYHILNEINSPQRRIVYTLLYAVLDEQ